MATKKQSRKTLSIGAVGIIAVGLAYAFWPQPTLVDMGVVTRGPMMLTINEEARTQVHDTYVISAPVSGRLLRVKYEPGDQVEPGETVVAQILANSPPVLNARESEQARIAVEAAEASLLAGQAMLRKFVADKNLAESNLARASNQRDIGTVSQANFEQAKREAESSQADLDNAHAGIAQRQAELANAKAAFIGLSDEGNDAEGAINIVAPIKGQILRIMEQSEIILAAGTPILELGNTSEDLEVIVELLSTDAVQVQVGDTVIIDNWGGETALSGRIKRIDPLAFTKFSALGVEEQRVNAIVEFSEIGGDAARLGHGFRVEVRIVIWESDDVVIVPSSALFRHDGEWAVFKVVDNKATLQHIEVAHNNGTQANVNDGLQPEDRVILYPAAELEDGARVASR